MEWVTRWRMQVSAAPVLPGIWQLHDGGYVASAQVRDPKERRQPGRRPRYVTIFRVLREVQTAKDARDWLEAEKQRVRDRDPQARPIPRWIDFAVSHFEHRVRSRDFASAATVDTWKRVLRNIYETAPWASWPVAETRYADLQDWRDMLPTLTWKVEQRVRGEAQVASSGRYGPRTLNTWLAIARTVWKAAVAQFELARDPAEGIQRFSTKTAKTYTVEQPNALNPRTEIAEFLARLRVMYPRWYPLTLTGFVLGQRQCTLRPLRRRGPESDLDLVNKKLFIRRSHTRGRDDVDVMRTTKTGNDLVLTLPEELVEVLRQHVAAVDASPIGPHTDLLFPSPFTGRFLSDNCLRLPWRNVLRAMGLERLNLTPRAMRRTFQDMAEEAHLRTATAMAVSGFADPAMMQHYMTAHEDEVREGIGKVIDIATARKPAAKNDRA